MILINANVVARLLDPGDAQHQEAVDSIAALHQKGEPLRICAQTIEELYAIATRSRQGLGLTPVQALTEISAVKARFDMLPEIPLHAKWLELTSKYLPTNRLVFDARMVAAAVLGECTAILTFNTSDFSRFSEVPALHPRNVLGKSTA